MSDKKVIINGDLAIEGKFADKMRELKGRGAISTHRSGDNGIGKMLEDELGVEENSVQVKTRVDENRNKTFHYTEAFVLEGFSSVKLMQCIEDGDIEVNI